MQNQEMKPTSNSKSKTMSEQQTQTKQTKIQNQMQMQYTNKFRNTTQTINFKPKNEFKNAHNNKRIHPQT